MSELKKVAMFTNEYPPNVYGGAGVHVEYLSRELARLVPVEVRCFGDQDIEQPNLRVKGYGAWPEAKQNTDPRFGGALDAFYRSLSMAKDTLDAGVVHCHTWYTDMAGFLAKKLWGIPLVLTIHSLEPLRPWKVEQLGNGYHLSSWMERTGIEDADAVIAVSQETRNDVLRFFPIAPEKIHVIHNGIDLQQYRKNPATDALVKRGVDPIEAVRAVRRPDHAPEGHHPPGQRHPRDRPVAAGGAVRRRARHQGDRPGDDRARRRGQRRPRGCDLDPGDAAARGCDPVLLARGGVLLPVGLRAVRDHQPGGDGLRDRRGGLGGRRHPRGGGAGRDRPAGRSASSKRAPSTRSIRPQFSHELAAAINQVALDPALRRTFGDNGRKRVEDHFSWTAIAQRTLELYRSLV